MFEIVDFVDVDESQYRALYKRGSNATPFHSYDWLCCLQDANRSYKLQFMCLYEDKKLVAAMPFCNHSKALFFMVSGVYNTYGGFVYLDGYQDVLKTAQYKVFTSICLFSQLEQGLYNDGWTIRESLTYLLDITQEYEAVLQSIHGKTRNQIKKSQKSGVVIERLGDNVNDLNECKKLHKLLYEKHKVVKGFDAEFVNAIFAKSLIPDSDLPTYVAKINGVVIAYGVFIFGRSQIFYYMSAFNQEYSKLNPINGILDYVIKMNCNKDFNDLNFGAIPLGNDNLNHFKTRWGARPHKVMRIDTKLYDILYFIRSLLK